jgi:hypothetical protein
MAVEKDKFTKSWDRYFSLICKYPSLVHSLREVNSLNSHFNKLNEITRKMHTFKDDDFLEYFYKVLELLEKVETNLTKKVKSSNYKVPVYNFNPDLIIDHCHKIEKSEYQLTYLQIILQYYKPYLATRYNEFENVMLEVGDDFISKYVQMQKQFFETKKLELGKNDFGLLFHCETFEEKIQNEMAVINHLYEHESSSNVLNEINFPPGTVIKQSKNEDLEKAEQSPQKEYLTTDDVMKMLGIGRTTIHNYMKQGKLIP